MGKIIRRNSGSESSARAASSANGICPACGRCRTCRSSRFAIRSVESAQKFAKEFDIPEVIDDWAEMLDRPDLDIIWIGTPPVLHAPITISALEAGKHVFCQARMAMNLREGREMLVAAQARPQSGHDALPAAARHEGREVFPEAAARWLRGRALAFPAHRRQRRSFPIRSRRPIGGSARN